MVAIPEKKAAESKSDLQPNNPHDRFARKTVGNPLYAADFLKYYVDSLVVRHINLDCLVAAPTHYLTDELKEVILDISFAARLRDEVGGSEVLIFMEHKSTPSRLAPLQVGTHAFLSLYFGWTTAKYSETYKPSIPLMIVVYNGNQDIDEEILFQDIFQNIPEELRRFVPQFQLIVINLRRFHFGNLPGKPETQAIVESMKRATDGTFTKHFDRILELVKAANLGKQQTYDLTNNITRYCTWTNNVTSEQIVQSITKIFNGTEGIDMANTIQKSILQEGIEIGETRGELKCRVNDLLTFLRARFTQVPQHIVDSLNQRTDAIALESLVALAATCSSLDEFAAEL
ncbi:MAG: Rpn family recombination-promoting nuclease/putative transposase [Planctomycetaceae bacterium]|jgi:hypothetical protein|nr:Rpn family recombination-promoting nuclease/putative transposase [Planctomycetaceae bacterium]